MRQLADACHRTTRLSLDEPFLREAYVFGDVLDGVDPIDHIQLAFTVDLPPEKVPWRSQPLGTSWLVDSLRLDKGGFVYWWRSRHEPVWNHVISDPVRFWSVDGTEDAVLDALRDRRFSEVPRRAASPVELRQRVEADLARALGHLRAVHQTYWDRDWRKVHRGGGRYPEDHLFEAVDGYLDLLEATQLLADGEEGDHGRD